MKAVILGNAGAGKSTLARRLAGDRDVPILSLDDLAFVEGTPDRRPLEDSIRDLEAFVAQHDTWVIEGCYADLVEAVLPHCEVLHFLNPGVDACVDHCRARPWEPDKFPTAEAQQDALDYLIGWVRQYESREDEYGLTRHRAVFETFDGDKHEYTSAEDYP